MSLLYLTSDWTRSFFATEEQFMTSYFVLFIVSALFNGFNVRDDGFGIFRNLRLNPDFLRVFFMIVAVQFCIVNISALPFTAAKWIGNMFSCVPFGAEGWLLAIVLASSMIPVDLMRKWVSRKRTNVKKL